MKDFNKPFSRSFAAIPGGVWGGAYPGGWNYKIMKEKLQGLRDCGVVFIFNLMEECEVDHNGDPFVPYDAVFENMFEGFLGMCPLGRCTRIPIPDMGVVDERTMRDYLQWIHWSASRVPIFVHCWGGKGRTGSLLGCFLVDLGIVNGKEAITYFNRVRWLYKDTTANEMVPQTQEQRDMILNWQPIHNLTGGQWQ